MLLLDSEGKRVAVKYYCHDWPTYSAKLAFEKSIFTKTQKTNARNEGIAHPVCFPLIFMDVCLYAHESHCFYSIFLLTVN